MPLRDYQRRTLDDLYRWMAQHSGNPAVVLATGAGKSWCIAALCSETIAEHPSLRILVLARQGELLTQNYEKLREYAPDVECGIYCASLGRKEIEQVTFASVQSAARCPELFKGFHAVVTDECHQVSPNEETQFQRLIREIEPNRVVGWTATPYRLGQGLITQGEGALFHDIIDPVTIEELLHKGAIAPLRSKVTNFELDATGVHTRGGDYIESELAAAVNSPAQNSRVAAEIVRRAEGRRSWIVFCAGVDHAKAMAAELMQLGVMAACVHGQTPKEERDHLLQAYKDGRLTCLSNANVLCLSDDTEILTASGFVGIDEMSEGHLIAGWQEDGSVEFRKPLHIVRRLAMPNEKVVEAYGNSARFSVTGNHRMVVQYGKGRSKTKVESAEVVAGKKFSIPTCGNALSVPVPPVPQPALRGAAHVRSNSYSYRRKGYDAVTARDMAERLRERLNARTRQLEPAELRLSDCMLIGFWLADGTRSGGRCSITQSTRYQDNIEWLRVQLRDSEIHYTEHRRTVRGARDAIQFAMPWGRGGDGQGVDTRLAHLDYWLNKDGVEHLLALSADQVEAVMHGFWLGDGCHHSNLKYKVACGTNRKLLSRLQEMCSLHGISATIAGPMAGRKKNHNDQWKLSWWKRHGWHYSGDNVMVRDARPDERFWCVTSSTSYLICRRKGKVFVTGNTTGFDAPDTDLIALLRPTQSPGLYFQEVGRGMRLKSHTDHCLVLDFAKVIATHGPITAIRPPDAKGKGTGEAPVKVCEKCDELVHTSCRVCPTCGFEWPAPKAKDLELQNDDIMKVETHEMRPDEWSVYVKESKAGIPMVVVDYLSCFGSERVTEYLCLAHDGYAKTKGQKIASRMFADAGAPMPELDDLEAVSEALQECPPPAIVKFQMDGRWPRVKSRVWETKWSPKEDAEKCEEIFGDDQIPF